MTFQKKGWGGKPAQQPAAQAPARKGPTKPTFQVQESEKTGKPFAKIGDRVVKEGRGGASLMLFPSKFEGQFLGMALNGWGRGMIPVSADQVDVQGNKLIVDFGWLKIEVSGDNVQELVEFLQYAQEAPKEASFQQGQEPAQPQQQSKPSWKK